MGASQQYKNQVTTDLRSLLVILQLTKRISYNIYNATQEQKWPDIVVCYNGHLGPLLLTWFNFNPNMDNYILYTVRDEITYPFLNLRGATIEV